VERLCCVCVAQHAVLSDAAARPLALGRGSRPDADDYIIDNRKHYYYQHEEVERVTGRQPVDPSNISTYLISTRPADSRQTHRRSANRSSHSLT
jgi:hypothetical protein